MSITSFLDFTNPVTTLTKHLTEATSPYVFGINLGVIGAVSLVEAESVLKVAVLSTSLVLTLMSCALKWRNRDKPNA